MSKIYRFTGPPENWITGIGLNMWALNDNNKNIWDGLEEGDIALLHATAKSDYGKNKTVSAVVGYAVISGKKWIEKNPVWMQEKAGREIIWPYVFTFDQVCLLGDTSDIDFVTDNVDKDDSQLDSEVISLSTSGVPISALNEQAKQQNPDAPHFPVNGSSSGVNEVYERLLLENQDDFFLRPSSDGSTYITDEIDNVLDKQIATEDIAVTKQKASQFKPSNNEGYVKQSGVTTVRKDNETQKRRVARIENYTCQICGFRCEYTRKNGDVGHIIQVDHILDKSKGGTEEMKNLWVLCPNCHALKTYGVIKIDLEEKLVTRDGEVVEIRDGHLGWE